MTKQADNTPSRDIILVKTVGWCITSGVMSAMSVMLERQFRNWLNAIYRTERKSDRGKGEWGNILRRNMGRVWT